MPAVDPNRSDAPYRVWITPKRSIVAAPVDVARALAAECMPISPGEINHPAAVPSMLGELRDLGYIFASERVHDA